MKKLIALLALVLVSASTMMYAQESERAVRRADRKAQRDAERARLKAEEQAADAVAYQQAVQALKNKQFVLEADQVIFRNGQSAFVSSTTNFVMMNGQRSTVQVAFNTPYPGPNGIGGVTVDGSASDMKICPQGDMMICSNAGANSVAVFCIHKDSGLLEEICNLKISGSYPKTLSFLPDCEHFIVLNQESNEIVTFSIKKGANYFLMEGKPLEIQTPNCIQFYDLDA